MSHYDSEPFAPEKMSFSQLETRQGCLQDDLKLAQENLREHLDDAEAQAEVNRLEAELEDVRHQLESLKEK